MTDGPAEPTALLTAAPTDDGRVTAVSYPSGIYTMVSPAFSALRQSNTDVMGWLTVEELVDAPVVLRDNTYYLDHGTDRAKNVNGALFLDESTAFEAGKRPSTFIIFGHNMKTGEMFGQLKKYLTFSWYAEHPLITLNSVYEDGTYIVFAAATVRVEESVAGQADYVDVYDLYSDQRAVRQTVAQKLISISIGDILTAEGN